MRSCALGFWVAAVLSLWPQLLDSTPKDLQLRQAVWFVVNQSDKGELQLEPLAKNVGGHLVPVPNGCNPNDPAYKKFVTENFGIRRPYDLSFRGRLVGSAVFDENTDGQRSVLASSSGKPNLIPVGLSGLATTQVASHPRVDRGWAATPLEAAAAKEIAMNSFKEAGVPVSLLTKITLDKLERAYLLPSNTPSLIGSFSIDVSEQEGSVHSLFFIATKKGTKYHNEFVWTKISKGETDNEQMKLTDYADLFGDGQDEVVAELDLYENYFHVVYERKRNSSVWEQIFEAQASYCE